MRKISTLAAGAVAVTVVGLQSAHAGLLGMPMGLQSAIQHIKFETTTLAPMAYTQFCLRYGDGCRTNKIMFRSGRVHTAERWDDFKEVNKSVNEDVIPKANELGLAAETWLISPDCGTKSGDLVLDNLTSQIEPWSRVSYR
jgi:predicted transglutaminase-like cysteine proteinase